MSNATRILLALVIGLSLGIFATGEVPAIGTQIAYWLDILGNLWLNGLRMTVVPLVVALLITGIVKSAEAARAGPMAARTVIWIVCMMVVSAALGAFLTPALLSLWPMPAESAAALRGALTSAPAIAEQPPMRDFLVALIPTNPVSAAANDSILPLMIFTLTFAFAITRLTQQPRVQMAGFFSALADAMIIVIEWVLKLAPIGVFALAFVVGARSGFAALGALAHYIVTVSIVGIIVGAFAYPVAVFAGKIRLGEFVRRIAPVQAFAVSTQSSLASLPLMLKKSEELGVRETTAGLVLPMAVALLRVTGPAMNIAVALYVANWFGVELSAFDYGIAVFVAALTSMGAVSLPGSVSFVTSIAPLCLALGIPIEPLALLIAVETLPDIFRTTGNVQMDVALATAIEAPERRKPLLYRELGHGLKVSALGVGCMPMIKGGNITYGEDADPGEAIKTIHAAIDIGINFFDTAQIYGPFQNEELVAEAIKGKRDGLIIASKFGFKFDGANIVGVDGSAANAKSAVEGTLKRLGIDCLDLYYQHRVDPSIPIEETVGAMADLVTEGKIKHIGLSEAGPETLRRAAAVAPISALQSEYSLWERDVEDEILPTCRALGIGFVPYSPLGRGFLTGAFRSLDALPENDWRRQDPRFQGDNFAANLSIVDVVGQIAEKHNASHAQIALAWLLAQGNDIVPIPGFKRRVTMADSAKACDIMLDADDLAKLDSAAPRGGTSGPRYGERGMKMVRL